MASLRCHGDSDCNKTQIRRNFHLYIKQLWKPFFDIFTHGDVVKYSNFGGIPPKKSSRATLNETDVTSPTSTCEHPGLQCYSSDD